MVSCSGSLVPLRSGEGEALLSLSTRLRLPAALYGACPALHVVPVFRYSTNSPQKADSVAPAFCAFPGRSSSGSQELDGRTLPGCGAPSPLHSPSLSFLPRLSGACTLSLAATLPADVDHPESQEVFG